MTTTPHSSTKYTCKIPYLRQLFKQHFKTQTKTGRTPRGTRPVEDSVWNTHTFCQ